MRTEATDCLTLSIEKALSDGRSPGAALLSGPPGCGKTSYASRLASRLGAQLVYHLLHSWTDDQELHYGVDVRAAVAGESQHVRQPGVLAVAALASQQARVVLCLDEVDKTTDRTEALLLDFLESGRVPVRPGEYVQAHLPQLVTVLTSNDTRPLSDALLRRVRRVRLEAMPFDQLVELACAMLPASYPVGAVRLLARLGMQIAGADQASLTVPELVGLARDVIECAASHQDVRTYLGMWAARGEEGAKQAASAQAAAVWAEVSQWRRARR